MKMAFLDGSAGKKSICDAGDAGDMCLTPGWGRPPIMSLNDLKLCLVSLNYS